MEEDENRNILSGGDVPFPIPPYTVGQVFFQRLLSAPPDHVILVEAETGRSATCSELLLLSIKVAEAFGELHLQPGDCVTLAGKNGIDITAAAIATLLVGATMSPVDPTMKPYEFEQILKLTESKVIFSDAEISSVISETLPNLEREPMVILLCGNPDDEYPFARFEDFVKDEVDLNGFRPAQSADTTRSIAVLACSSGTTGLPKAVQLSDKSMIFQLLSWRHAGMKYQDGNPIWLHVSHFFWITGISLFLACTCGLQKRILIRDFSADTAMKAIEEHKTEIAIMPPAHLDLIVNSPDFENYDLSSMKMILAGGAALQKSTYDKTLSMWPGPPCVLQGYGCTEVGGLFTCMAPNQDITSVGKNIPGTKTKFVKDDGEIAGPGEIGELCIKSASIMNGYAKNEEATKIAIDEDGWLHTGDTGYFNDELIYISGRIKELIKYKGMQIAPSELEEVIHSIPGVADVGVAGIKIDPYTCHPMALVVKSEASEVTEEDVVKCVNETLSDYKHLRGGVCFVDEIPRTPTGKIRRNLLQSFAEELYMGD